MTPCRAALVIALPALLALAREAAADGPRSARVEYDAPTACPDERSFVAQIRARSAKVVVTPDGASVVRVKIVPAGRAGRFDGDVVLADASGREATRHVEGGCPDVASALALITALALDPTASVASDPTPGPAPTPSTAPPAAVAAAPAPTTARPPSESPPPAKVESPRKAADDAAARLAGRDQPLQESDARTHGWGWSIGAEAGLTTGVAPSPLLSVPGFVDVWRRTTSAFAPSLRLRFERADSGSGTGASGDFTWTAGSLDLCPVAGSFGRVRFSPCVRGEAGELAATGTGVAPARTDSRPWVSVGLVARVRITLVGSLFVEAEAGGFAPIVRDRFFVEPDDTIQRAPVVAFAGAAGVGVTFW